MLAVKAVSNYTASAPDHVDVRQGEIYYVLSMTTDQRKYFLSTSARVPFARGARCGFAPLPLFAIVGDTLPASLRPTPQAMLSRPVAAAPRVSPKRARSEDDNVSGDEDKKRTNSGGIKGNLTAAARSIMDGFRGRKVAQNSHAPSTSGIGSGSKFSSPAATAATPLPQILSAAMLAYKRTETGIEFTIRFDLPDGQNLTVHRSMADFEAMRAAIPGEHSKHLPAFQSITTDEERALLRARGKRLNFYLKTVLHLHNQLLAQGDAGLPICDFLYRPAKPVAAAVLHPTGSGGLRRANSVVTRHIAHGVASPMFSGLSAASSSGRPLNPPEMHPTTDSGYSTMAGTRKNSHPDVAMNGPTALDAEVLIGELSRLATSERH